MKQYKGDILKPNTNNNHCSELHNNKLISLIPFFSVKIFYFQIWHKVVFLYYHRKPEQRDAAPSSAVAFARVR